MNQTKGISRSVQWIKRMFMMIIIYNAAAAHGNKPTAFIITVLSTIIRRRESKIHLEISCSWLSWQYGLVSIVVGPVWSVTGVWLPPPEDIYQGRANKREKVSDTEKISDREKTDTVIWYCSERESVGPKETSVFAIK